MSDSAPAAPPSFEEAITRLETLVSQMERGDVPLEQLIERYGEGAKLAVLCRTRLAALEQKIETLTAAVPPNGEWSDFSESTVAEPAAPRRQRASAVSGNDDTLPF